MNLAETLLEYAQFTGAKEIDKTPGLWINKPDDTWTLKCNGHKDEIEGILPYHFHIEFNGWPAGIINLITGEGVICAGDLGNERTLISCLKSKITGNSNAYELGRVCWEIYEERDEKHKNPFEKESQEWKDWNRGWNSIGL